ncbi:MAG: ImmA/IrrE family metallo-endopeptidase [Halanaerobiales bacterium]|nr:ImmA/IrrE family metallo-endopeptidase [Halanaerobiales bacterium]
MSKEKVKELLEELEERIDEVRSSEEFKEYLRFFSKFHNYSYQNIMLIKMQKSDATLVAGYKQWQKKFDRHVKKGEKGIVIMAPYKYKKEVSEIKKVVVDGEVKEKEVKKEKQFVSFRPVYVFDVSQTEGKELPSWSIEEIEEENKQLLKPLIQYANKTGITVDFKGLKDGLKGYSKGGEIVVDECLNNTEKASVCCHELAHEKLHYNCDTKELSKEIVELEAEAVSFVVMEYFNIKTLSEKYLALYKKGHNLMDSFKRIKSVSKEIIKGILAQQ